MTSTTTPPRSSRTSLGTGITCEDLLALLPPLERRARRHAARRVAARLAAGADLLQVANEALAARADCGRRFAQAHAHFGSLAGAPWAARAALYEAAMGRPPHGRDRRALRRGQLDAEALGERVARIRLRFEADALVAFGVAHALSRGEGVLPPGLPETAALLLAQSDSWRLPRAGLLALAEHAAAGRPPGRALLEHAAALASDPAAPVWTQTAALRLIAAAGGARALELLAARLRPAPAQRDDFFVRAEAVRLIARGFPAEAPRVLPGAQRDPSEHVRMTLAAALGALGARPSLRPMADPSREPAARVRAAAALALAPLAPEDVAAVLLSDPDPLTRRAALEAAEEHGHHPALREAIDTLTRSAPNPELARLACEARERIAHTHDTERAGLLAALRARLEPLAEGQETVVHDRELGHANEQALGRALAVLATDGHGFEVRRLRAGYAIRRGDRKTRQAWRLWHELRHPTPDKRQSHLHSVGRAADGALRAPPGRLAEVTATKVPGERVLAPVVEDWGRHIPTVDDLLTRPSGGVLQIFSSFGVTDVRFPAVLSWPNTRRKLVARYAELARVRQQSLPSGGLGAFGEALTALGFACNFRAHPSDIARSSRLGDARAPLPAEPTSADLVIVPPPTEAPRARRTTLTPLNAVLPALPTVPLLESLRAGDASAVAHALGGAASALDGGLNQLAAVGVAALGLFLVRLHDARRDIDDARAAIPLSIGGWGTRGKSGTERIKAGMFQGLGYEVLVKTTGCEAMLIHAIPDRPAREVFIYRTYDKATIWEQRDLLRLAADFGADVFLWECMALRPELVEILERHWMRDDLVTLTNTYPDHENIQGPAGTDIPRVMTKFQPPGGTVITSEEQMLPILRDAARAESTRLVEVGWRQAALLPGDILARFPYEEHPRNIALVLALADELGIERDMALKEMADNVVPDLGVLKTYPEVAWRGRRLVFSNGMSANERAGFMSNWRRLGFDQHRADDAGEWVVTVVNNRADRVSRSMVFAQVLVEDAAAHRHVLIGSNLGGLHGYIDEALAHALRDVHLVPRDGRVLRGRALHDFAIAQAQRAFERVKLGTPGAERLAAEAAAMARGLGLAHAAALAAPERFLAALAEGHPTLAASRRPVHATLAPALLEYTVALGPYGKEAVDHLCDLAARHATVLRWAGELRAAVSAGGPALAACEERLRALLAELLHANLVTLPDPDVTGDQIVDAITRLAPPGARVRILGVQNIKGTGLDFAYRWVALDLVHRRAEALAGVRPEALLSEARALGTQDDAGALEVALAEAALHRLALQHPEPVRGALRALAVACGQRRAEAEARLAAAHVVIETASPVHGRATHAAAAERRKRQPGWARAAESVIDVYDGLGRRRSADRVLRALTEERLSHARAADAMRALIKRGKGGWLFA